MTATPQPLTATGTPREPMTHELKTWQSYFHAVYSGEKLFEIRRDDRGFRVGDALRLRETEYGSGAYTGRECTRTITYILRREDDLGLQDGFAILSLADPTLTQRDAQAAVMVEAIRKYAVVNRLRQDGADVISCRNCSAEDFFYGEDEEFAALKHQPSCVTISASSAALALLARLESAETRCKDIYDKAADWSCKHAVQKKRADDAEQQVAQLRHVQFTPGGDNHHNALICPYCNPNKAALRTPGTVEVCAKTICARSPIGFEGWRCMDSYCPLNGRTEPGSAA